jgi:hypothetical protein
VVSRKVHQGYVGISKSVAKKKLVLLQVTDGTDQARAVLTADQAKATAVTLMRSAAKSLQPRDLVNVLSDVISLFCSESKGGKSG